MAPKNDGGGGGRRLAARSLGTTGLPGARVPDVVSTSCGRRGARGCCRERCVATSAPLALADRYRDPAQASRDIEADPAANGLRLSSCGTGSTIPIRSGSRSIVCPTSFVESERGLGRRTGRFSCSVRHPNSVVLLLFSCEFPHSLRSPGVSRDPATRMRNEGRRRACTGKPAQARRAGTWWAKASVPSPSRFRPASRDTGSARVRSRRSAGR